jgi:hypothetical protein
MNTFNEFEENYYPYELNQNYKIIEPFNGVTIQNDKIIEHFVKLGKSFKNMGEITKNGDELLQQKVLSKASQLLGASKGATKINPAEITRLTRKYQKMYRAGVEKIEIADATVLSKNKNIQDLTNILKQQAKKQMKALLDKVETDLAKELENADNLVKKVEVEVKTDISKAKKAIAIEISQKVQLKKINTEINTDINKIETDTNKLTEWAKSSTKTNVDAKLSNDLEGLSKKIGDFKKSKDNLLDPKMPNPVNKVNDFKKNTENLQNQLESLDKDILKEFVQNKKLNFNDIFSDNSTIFKSCSLCKNTDTSKRTKFKEIISKKKNGQDINDFIDNLSADEFKFLISDFKQLGVGDNNYLEQIKYLNKLKDDINDLSGKIVDARPRTDKLQVKTKAKQKLNQLGVLKNNKIDYDKIADKNLPFLKKKFAELNRGENLDDVSPERFKVFYEFQKLEPVDEFNVNFKNINNNGAQFDNNFENNLFEKMFQKKINDKLDKLAGSADSENADAFNLIRRMNSIPKDGVKKSFIKEVNQDFNKKIFKELKSGSKNDLKLQKFKQDFDGKIETKNKEINDFEAEIKQLEAKKKKVSSNLDKSSEFANEISAAKSKLAITKQALNDELSKKQLYESIIDGKKSFDDLDIDALNQFNKYINELNLDELKGNLKNLVGEKKGLSELLNSTADGRKLLKNAEFEADMDFINAKLNKKINIDIEFETRTKSFFENIRSFFTKKKKKN